MDSSEEVKSRRGIARADDDGPGRKKSLAAVRFEPGLGKGIKRIPLNVD